MRSICVIAVSFLFLVVSAQNLRENGAVPFLAKSVFGGLIPDFDFQYASTLVDVILYSDGTLVFTHFDEQTGARSVKIGYATSAQVTIIKTLANNANIDQWKQYYSDPTAPTDGPSTCIRYWPPGQPNDYRSVCQYYGGAPAEFNKITKMLEDMKTNAWTNQVNTLREYKPTSGWLQTFSTTCEWQRECATKEYSWTLTSGAPSLSAATVTPVELTGTLLEKAWNAQNQGGVVYYYKSNWYKLTVVVDDLSLKPIPYSYNPTPYPVDYPKPTPPYSRSMSPLTLGLIIAGGALGLILLITFVCCMVRRSRRMRQERNGIDAIPLTSSSDWSSTNNNNNNMTTTSSNNFSSSYLQTSYSQPTAPYVQTNDPNGGSYSMPTVIYTLPTQTPNVMYTQPGNGSSYYFVPVATINPQQTN